MGIIGFVACKNGKEAEKIAIALLKKRLVACANIVPKISSLYWWKGKIVQEEEALLLLKTLKKNQKKIIQEIKKIHSYSIPCIEFMGVKTNKECEKWLWREIK